MINKKICKICGTEFRPSNGHSKLCSDKCRKILKSLRAKNYYKLNRNKKIAYQKEYEKDNRKIITIRRREPNKAYRRERRPEILVKAKARHQENRRLLLLLYGGKCACCGEITEQFLGIDHINGGGSVIRRNSGTRATYTNIIKEGYRPDKYRVLCHNCNLSRGFYGFCPHEQQKKLDNS